MIISVHLPKTAGESFAASLKEHFKDKFYKDYHDKPINTPGCKRKTKALCDMVKNNFINYNNIECIHGHFLPVKYSSLRIYKKIEFITWLRDPIERMASHYYYWLRNYDPDNAPPLYQKMIKENWSLIDFCFRKELRNFYSQFLWGFPISSFSFIGIVEYYDDDFQFFQNEIIKTTLKSYRININPVRSATSYISDSSLRERIEKFHQRDVNLYKMALTQRLLRRGK